MGKYFEGWYFKHQNKIQTLALIAGKADDHAFIQIVTDERSYHISFPLSAYQKRGLVRIADNHFDKDGISLAIHTDQLKLSGDLSYLDATPLKGDIMGPFRFFPMECRHSVVSMRHHLEGALKLNGALFDFCGGYGYSEGDRGRSFPHSYTWMQSCDFDCDLSIMASAARIPFAGLRFWGCLCIIWYRGQSYRLATYRGGKILKRSEIEFEIRQGPYRLHVEIPAHAGYPLYAPDRGRMSRTIHETPSCPARFRFWDGDTPLFDKQSAKTSYEYVP